MGVEWKPENFAKTVTQNAVNRVRQICSAGVRECKTSMPRATIGDHSKPGEWPHIQYASLVRNIGMWVDAEGDKVHGYIGVLPLVGGGKALGGVEQDADEGYPFWLEVGTRKMLPRPWLTLMMDSLEQQFPGLRFTRNIGNAIARGVTRGLHG